MRYRLPETGVILGLALLPLGVRATGVEIPANVEPFLENHCYECHDDLDQEGDLNLLDHGRDLGDPRAYLTWAQVFERVESGEMPPRKKARPNEEERRAFLESLEKSLVEVELEKRRAEGRSGLRRLNRGEYEASLRDLLALPHLDIADSLPPEGSAHGFDKSADALDFSHVHASRLMEVADEALRKAVAPSATRPESTTVRFEVRDPENLKRTCGGFYAVLKQTHAMPLVGLEVDKTMTIYRGNFLKRDPGRAIDHPPYFDALALFINGESNLGLTIRTFKVPVAGYYKIRVNGFGILNDHGELKPSERLETVGLYSNDRTLGFIDLPSYKPTTGELTVWLEPDDVVKPLVATGPFTQIKVPLKAKPGEKLTDPGAYTKFRAHGVAFRWFELEGPFFEDSEGALKAGGIWPPESHRRLFGDLDVKMANRVPSRRGAPVTPSVADVVTADPFQDARRLMRSFLGRALRRPVTGEDMKLPLAIVHKKLRRQENFMEAMIAGYRAVLTSPDFLLLQGKAGPLDDFALAERLSYFLTDSAPDAPLRNLARAGRLREPQVLRRQVERLLDGERAARFVEHFLDKWLKLEDIALTEPDANLYPDYTPLLMDSALWEARAYFSEMLRDDLGARYVVASDFAMVNQRLAELYGIEGVRGNEIRKVSLPKDSVRGGFLTQAAVLKTTANGTITSPVVRGDYILTHLLGDPPPPPPPAVPAVEPDIAGATTIRAQLAKHREDAACAGCHAKIDPPGFALESFDVMGGWRTRYRSLGTEGKLLGLVSAEGRPGKVRAGPPVEAAGELPDGSAFKDIREFRKILLGREEEIARHLLEQLIVYATGAPVSFADRPVVDAMMEDLETRSYGVRSMVHAIVQSPLFLEK